MRKVLVIFLLVALCLSMMGLVNVGNVVRPNLAIAATGEYKRVFLETYLKSLPRTGGHYTCAKASSPYTYNEQDWKGVDLQYLLEQEVGLGDGTSGLKVQARDSYTVGLTLDGMRGNGNVRGLKTLLGYLKADPSADNVNAPHGAGAPWVAPVEPTTYLDTSEGPFRLIVPQTGVEGPIAANAYYTDPPGTGTAPNWNLANKKVAAIEVLPLPAGVTELSAAQLSAIPTSQVVVYGNIHPYAISSISPSSAQPGTEVTINGYGFSSIQGSSYVSFGGMQATDYIWGCQQIKCKVPAMASGEDRKSVV